MNKSNRKVKRKEEKSWGEEAISQSSVMVSPYIVCIHIGFSQCESLPICLMKLHFQSLLFLRNLLCFTITVTTMLLNYSSWIVTNYLTTKTKHIPSKRESIKWVELPLIKSPPEWRRGVLYVHTTIKMSIYVFKWKISFYFCWLFPLSTCVSIPNSKWSRGLSISTYA